MHGRESLVVALTVALAVIVFLVTGENSNCEYRTCSECIGAPTCVWCSNPNITLVELDSGGTLTHCISSDSSKFGKFIEVCKDGITNPVTVNKTIKDEDLSETPIVQLKPQQVSLEMRAGKSARITVKYKHLSNYPLDVYCLMDGSKSMLSSKDELANLTADLVKDLEKISNNMQLGFGMFVDKPMLPYTDMFVWNGANCKGCVETFSFKNILPLTQQREEFENKVRNTKGSTNVDLPEGTLDALMQVASCTEKVGWRPQGLKVVVVYTDAGFHIAGDGKLAGIANPNDMQCHLDDRGEYTHSKLQDYPSISELHNVLERNSVYTTFAVTKELIPAYSILTNRLPRSECSDIKYNSSYIVNLITGFAKDIISTVELKKPNNIMQEVVVNVTSRCKGNEETTTSKCVNMSPGDEAEFFLNIKVKSCPKEKHHSTTLNFTLDGYSEFFLLDLKLLCQCECDGQDDQGFIPNADECSNEGNLMCGVCSCHEGFSGDKCQCKDGDFNNQVDEKNCIHPNSSTSAVCSGQGECICGMCKCKAGPNPNEVITGQYCQCTNYKNCYGANGNICSGHGECKCDKCYCSDGWEGQFCDCQKSITECQKSDEEEICSSHGKCVCNQCQCEEDYLGKYCQDCKNCESKCDEHNFCVQCLIFDKDAACTEHCSSYDITIVSDMSKEYGQVCSSTDNDGCNFLYQFKDRGDKVQLWAQNQKECPVEINPWAVVGGILGAVVLVGMLLLIAWKVVTNIKDQREYESFLKNRSMAIWSENVSPIYKPATTMVQNPLFESSVSQN